MRPVRVCDSCGGVDDHPRHVVATEPGRGATRPEVAEAALAAVPAAARADVVRQVNDTSTTMKHMDCCRADGCPDGSCHTLTRGAEDKRGADLLAHLTGRDDA